jgi:hypothetical protein
VDREQTVTILFLALLHQRAAATAAIPHLLQMEVRAVLAAADAAFIFLRPIMQLVLGAQEILLQ